jgi:hypothetical protein
MGLNRVLMGINPSYSPLVCCFCFVFIFGISNRGFGMLSHSLSLFVVPQLLSLWWLFVVADPANRAHSPVNTSGWRLCMLARWAR